MKTWFKKSSLQKQHIFWRWLHTYLIPPYVVFKPAYFKFLYHTQFTPYFFIIHFHMLLLSDFLSVQLESYIYFSYPTCNKILHLMLLILSYCHMLNKLTLTTMATRAFGIIMTIPRLNLNGTADILVILSLGTFSHLLCGFSDSWQCLSITMGILFLCHPLCGKKIHVILQRLASAKSLTISWTMWIVYTRILNSPWYLKRMAIHLPFLDTNYSGPDGIVGNKLCCKHHPQKLLPLL